MKLDLCGIDEAGRGPLAGPLVFAGVVLHKEIVGLNDSKKLTTKKREVLFDEILQYSTYKIVFTSAEDIDTYGISTVIKKSLQTIMSSINASTFLFDGNCSYGIQTLVHMIKADATIPQVSAASILAKVSRDRFMDKIAHKYPNYNFEKHKGYGTPSHIEEIKKYGLSDIHRKSFKLKQLEQQTLPNFLK